MDKLQQIFIAEAEQLVGELELALLDFEKDHKDRESIQVIFRVMHTLKGSAGMFGFDALSKMTHDMESIYDAIRAGTMAASAEIVEITLDMVDHLRTLILDQHLEDPMISQNHERLLEKISGIVANPAPAQMRSVPEIEDVFTYYIYLKPKASIFRNGTNVLFLVDELSTLGKAIVLSNLTAVPSLKEFTEDCFTDFEIILSTERTRSEIEDVFIFVEDSCELFIEKLSESDLLQSEAFTERLKKQEPYGPTLGLQTIKSWTQQSRQPVQPKNGQGIPPVKSEVNSIRVSSEKLDELMNLVSELVTSQARLSLTAERFNVPDLSMIAETIEKITRRLRDNAFNVCLVPIETLAIKFQRLVRDLSKELTKEISLVTEGLETEIDRSIIEKVSDPILHILRNCIDHGIEFPDERISKGKAREGKIGFKAYHSGTHVHIEISDDGKGIDIQKVKAKAILQGLIEETAQLSKEEILNLIFLPGFSTAESVTGVSGRGVGMDIVKRNIESVHGQVFVNTSKEIGTTFTIKLPLTLAIMEGLLVDIGGSRYLLPLSTVEKCFEIESLTINNEMSQKHVFDGEMLLVFNLRNFFNTKTPTPKYTQVIKVDYEFPVGVTVDSIIGEYQAVMKPLGDFYFRHEEFSGATILGDGTVALVLDTTSLLKQLITK